MRLLQVVYDKAQLVTVSDHRHEDKPHFVVSISVQVGDKMVDYEDVLIDETHPHYNNMVHNDYWDIWGINRVVEKQEWKVFCLVMSEKLKGLKITEWLTFTVIDTVYEFVPHPDGGLNEWVNDNRKRRYHGRHYTVEDALSRMYRIWNNFDGWKVFDGGVSMMDDEDIQELEIVGEDDETVPGEAVASPASDDYEAFKVFIVPRLARIKDYPALVLIANTYPPALLVVGIDGDKWYLLGEDADGSQTSISIWNTMQGVMEKMWEWRAVLSSPVAWIMRQQTMNGRFATIHTQEWNEVDGVE